MSCMDIWTLLWIGWGLAFAGIEGTAIAKGDWAGTLSQHLRKWFRVDTNLGRTVWLIFSALFFVAWFIPHIAYHLL